MRGGAVLLPARLQMDKALSEGRGGGGNFKLPSIIDVEDTDDQTSEMSTANGAEEKEEEEEEEDFLQDDLAGITINSMEYIATLIKQRRR